MNKKTRQARDGVATKSDSGNLEHNQADRFSFYYAKTQLFSRWNPEKTAQSRKRLRKLASHEVAGVGGCSGHRPGQSGAASKRWPQAGLAGRAVFFEEKTV
jgi:hypothetical protein